MANSRIGTLLNLNKGGTHDLLVLSFPNGFPESQLEFKFTDVPRKVSGVQKVVQTFLKTLLTSKGVDPLRPSYGTGFSAFVRTGNRPSTSEELYSSLVSFVEDASAQSKYYLNRNSTDKSSKLRVAELVDVYGAEDSITVFLRIITEAGEVAPVSIPFPQLDLKTNG